MLLLLLMTSAVSACASGSAVRDYCVLAGPIYVGREDVLSDETVRQILQHNESWEKICK